VDCIDAIFVRAVAAARCPEEFCEVPGMQKRGFEVESTGVLGEPFRRPCKSFRLVRDV
jgi:hypothetical protein